MNSHIQSRFDKLESVLTTEQQKLYFRDILSVVSSELCKMNRRLEKYSSQEIGSEPVSVTFCDSESSSSRITYVPGERLLIKVPPKITSEKIRADYLKIGELVKQNYKDILTIRSDIKWDDKNSLYKCSFQTVKGRARKYYMFRYNPISGEVQHSF